MKNTGMKKQTELSSPKLGPISPKLPVFVPEILSSFLGGLVNVKVRAVLLLWYGERFNLKISFSPKVNGRQLNSLKEIKPLSVIHF